MNENQKVCNTNDLMNKQVKPSRLDGTSRRVGEDMSLSLAPLMYDVVYVTAFNSDCGLSLCNIIISILMFWE